LRAALRAALVAALCIASAYAAPAAAAVRRSAPVPVSVSFTTRAAQPPVPRDFLGLSFELADLPRVASYGGRGNLVALLR